MRKEIVLCGVTAAALSISLLTASVTADARRAHDPATATKVRTERTADGKGEWKLRPKLIVEAHRYYFLLPWAAGEVLTHSFPEDVYAVPSGSSAQPAATYSFDSSGDPSGTSALGHTIELQSPHYSLDVIIDEAGRVRTESRRLP